jgi:hydroxymethylglutaryl-CoA lyase
VNRSITQALDATLQVIASAKAKQYQVRAYASLAFACPFEGAVSEDVVVNIARQYVDAGADVVVLADTLGAGQAHQVTSLVNKITPFLDVERIGLHLHDSSRRAHLLVKEGLRLGIRHFDAAVGGTGGCNFAPGSAGNISTEKLLRVCHEQGVSTDVIDEQELSHVNTWLSGVLARDLENVEVVV